MGEDNEVFVQWVSSVIVRAAAKGISFVVLAGFMAEFKVVLLKFNLPSGGVGSDFIGLTPVREVLVISPDNHGLIQRSGTK